MTDLSPTIAAKSDQLNADDLIGRTRTIRITKVSARPDTAEQPIAVNFEGDNGKPYYPCKSMRRVMVHCWGKDGSAYVGRAMTLYRDPDVQFGGMKVGGIRISHMSHIESEIAMALTATRGSKRAYKVKPLKDAPAAQADRPAIGTADLVKRIHAAGNAEALKAITEDPAVVNQRTWLAANRPELAAEVDAAVAQHGGTAGTDDPFGLPPLGVTAASMIAEINAFQNQDDVNRYVAHADFGPLDEDGAQSVRDAAMARLEALAAA
jgi:hypothetical protein